MLGNPLGLLPAHKKDECVIVVTYSQKVAKKSDWAVYLSKKKLVVNEIK